MKTRNIEDLSTDFKFFIQSLEGSDYLVEFNCKKFSYFGDVDFSIKNLRELHSEVDFNIDGDIVVSSYEKAFNDIKDALSYFANELRYSRLSSLDKQIIVKGRLTEFWNLIGNYFLIPPKIIYKHIPGDGTYFSDYLMWGFCYIFLNEKEGLVLSGSAWD